MQIRRPRWKSFPWDFATPTGNKNQGVVVAQSLGSAEGTRFLRLQSIYIMYILVVRGASMSKAKVFKAGNSQAVRLPKEFRFDVKEVEIFRRGDEVVLRKPKRNLRRALAILRALPDDFMADGRQDSPPQEREPL